MTTTLTPPSSGTITIDGARIVRDCAAVKQRFGIVPQHSHLEGELSARQNLEYHGRIYGMAHEARRRRIAELLSFAELAERQHDKAKTFSGGMQRKLMIAKSLMHSPDILLLDEPTVGLDAAWRRKIWDLLRRLNAEGLTIFLTTHYLEEAQTLCRRVGMIDEGALKKTGTPQEVIAQAGNFVLEHFQNGATAQQFFPTRDRALAAARQASGDCKVREANLEDAFVLLTHKRLEDAHAR
jgi:ABC-2 type transport system ATP-binding protein